MPLTSRICARLSQALRFLLAGVRRDHQILIVELGAENILNPGEDSRRMRSVFRTRAPSGDRSLSNGTKSSGLGTGWIYIVMPLRPRVTARSINGLASAASILKFDILASTQISGPKWRRSRCGLISPIRRLIFVLAGLAIGRFPAISDGAVEHPPKERDLVEQQAFRGVQVRHELESGADAEHSRVQFGQPAERAVLAPGHRGRGGGP